MSDPFGTPPAGEELISFKVPSEEDDPFRPIGRYDEEGKLAAGSTQKATTVGKCVALKPDKGPKGDMLIFSFVVTEGAFNGREFDQYVSFSPSARFKLIETYKALGLPTDKPYPKSAAIGVYVTLNLQDEEFNGRWGAKIKSVAIHPKGVGFRGAANLPS